MASMASIVDKIQKVPVKARLIALAVLVAALIAAYVFQFHMPMDEQIRQLESSLSELQTRMQRNESKIRNLDELKAEVKVLEQRLAVLTEQLPPESEVSGLLRQIQNLVNQSGLVLKLWRPERRRTHGSGLYEEIPIALTLSGGYHDAAVFFDQVSKMTRIVNILNIKMGGAKAGRGGRTELDITCTAVTFSAVEIK
jgi:type IV pilus assembly protein PilO